MTVKFEAFKADLEAICRKHQVVLASSMYDPPAVWDMEFGEEPIHNDDLLDKTREKIA